MLVFNIFSSKLSDGLQGMFIKYEDPMELGETATTLHSRFKFQNLLEQVADAVWEVHCSSV